MRITPPKQLIIAAVLLSATLAIPACAESPLTDDQREQVRELFTSIFRTAKTQPEDADIDRWLNSIDDKLLHQLATGTLTIDGDPNQPIFDNTWWPQGLTDLGVPRPATLDEHVRDPLEYTRQAQELIWQAQQPLEGKVDAWGTLSRSLSAVQTAVNHLDQQIESIADGDHSLERALQDLIYQGSPLDESFAQAKQVVSQHVNAQQLSEFIATSRANLTASLEPTDIELRRLHADPVDPYNYKPVAYDLEESHPIGEMHVSPLLLPMTVANSVKRAQAMHAINEREYRTAAFSLVHTYALISASSFSISPALQRTAIDRSTSLHRDLIEAMHQRYADETDLKHLLHATNAQTLASPEFIRDASQLRFNAGIDAFAYREARRKIPSSLRLRTSTAGYSKESETASSRGTQAAIATAVYDSFFIATDPTASANDRRQAQSVVDWLDQDKASDFDRRATLIMYLIEWPPIHRAYIAECYTNAWKTLLSIEIFRQTNKRLPETLEELGQSALEYTTDPLNPGQRLRYIIDDPVATLPDDTHPGFGIGYRLYTIGNDGIDNNGTFDHESPYRALRDRRASDLDHVFNWAAVIDPLTGQPRE